MLGGVARPGSTTGDHQPISPNCVGGRTLPSAWFRGSLRHQGLWVIMKTTTKIIACRNSSWLALSHDLVDPIQLPVRHYEQVAAQGAWEPGGSGLRPAEGAVHPELRRAAPTSTSAAAAVVAGCAGGTRSRPAWLDRPEPARYVRFIWEHAVAGAARPAAACRSAIRRIQDATLN